MRVLSYNKLLISRSMKSKELPEVRLQEGWLVVMHSGEPRCLGQRESTV